MAATLADCAANFGMRGCTLGENAEQTTSAMGIASTFYGRTTVLMAKDQAPKPAMLTSFPISSDSTTGSIAVCGARPYGDGPFAVVGGMREAGEQGDRTSCTALSARRADDPSEDADAQGAAQRETRRRDRKAASGGAVSVTGCYPRQLALIALNRRPGSSNRGLNSHQTPVRFEEPISSLEERPSRGEGTCGTGVHDRSETVHRGSLATSATCGGRCFGRPGAGPSLHCARLLGRARVP